MSDAPAGIAIRVDPWPGEAALSELMRAGWAPGYADILTRSLCHVCAYDGERLVGFVHVAWDGAAHGFVLDPTVHPDCRRRGVGRALVVAAAESARQRGAEWLHVDYEPHLEAFYAACGFRPTKAGLMHLRPEAS